MSKQILVVGGAGGIGLELVRALVITGATVRATVLNNAEKEHIEAQVPGVSDVLLLDLSNADEVVNRLGNYVDGLDRPLDAVAVCAAIGPIGPVETAPLQQFRDIFEVNVIAQMAIFKATISSLRQSRGRILFLSSILGIVAMPFFGAYCAAKFALEALGDILRREVTPWQVDVILAEPGGVRTSMTRDQLRWSTDALQHLSDRERDLYADLYKGHGHMAAGGEAMSSSPEAIAATLVEALTVDKPESRYLIGADAHGFAEAYGGMDDRQRDQFLLGLFGLTGAT